MPGKPGSMAAGRRSVLRSGALAAVCLVAPAMAPPAGVAAPPEAGTPELALSRLKAGNDRWVADRAARPDVGAARRVQVAGGQEPFAVVFSCIDSRVPPGLVFDQGLGDLMVVRTAAHTHDALVAGSLEYGPAELAIPLVVVLGHQSCGAVTAAVECLREGRRLPGHLADIVHDLRDPYDEARRQGVAPGQLVEATVRAQTRQTVAALRGDRLLSPLVAAGRLRVVGAYYRLDTGVVTFSG
ncbi:carbonic anhydrase [Kitasatospora purpeofusca]|uniref:carbonic anhydrase n=1 Tax=Kitasatospora purpeofusca TaxID=67352 RepID=UPI0022587B55|nr:carbonic anhydrase [Kitasatospora purpeofusca]MCX4755136.1 carbonic anhydrase [Kitasatospora purpeofusca]WSR36974.1 carbonic anhydrase [Kitasatospora purpeofusca]